MQYIFQPMKPRDSRAVELCEFSKPPQGEFNRIITCTNEATSWAYWHESNGRLCLRPAGACSQCKAEVERSQKE